MATTRRAIVLASSLVFVLLASTFSATPVVARDVTVQLFGSRTSGWGFTNATLSTPGREIVVVEGDNVTLDLTSLDGLTHSWFIDYDNDAADDGNEPNSPDFTDNVVWNFTANRNGTFLYRSRPAGDRATMWGLITILPPGSAPPGGPTVDLVILVGAGVAALAAVLAVAAVFGRRRKIARVPPPPPDL